MGFVIVFCEAVAVCCEGAEAVWVGGEAEVWPFTTGTSPLTSVMLSVGELSMYSRDVIFADLLCFAIRSSRSRRKEGDSAIEGEFASVFMTSDTI